MLSAVQIGYWFSSVGAARAVFLTVVLPGKFPFPHLLHSRSLTWCRAVAIKLTKPIQPIQLPVEPEEPLTSPTTESSLQPTRSLSPPSSPGSHAHIAHAPKYDLRVAQVSVGLDVLVYVLVVLSPSGLMFALATALGALGMGFGPAVQSVALTLYHQRGGKDNGRLFGAMGVVQALRYAL